MKPKYVPDSAIRQSNNGTDEMEKRKGQSDAINKPIHRPALLKSMA